jgi:hypothetical protein
VIKAAHHWSIFEGLRGNPFGASASARGLGLCDKDKASVGAKRKLSAELWEAVSPQFCKHLRVERAKGTVD